MELGWRRMLGVLVVAVASLAGVASVSGQAAPAQTQAPRMSQDVFKNVQVLRGIPADEFMDTMGMFASSLGFDCVSCHDQGISSNRELFSVATPEIQKARMMVIMMNTLNATNFAGEQKVTCFTCHRGSYRPEIVPDLALQYSDLVENPNAMLITPSRRESADAVFAKYIQVLGGAQRLAALTSYVATGKFTSFSTSGGQVPIDIYAKAPNLRTQVVHLPEGDSTKVYDGKNVWVAERWRPLPLMPMTGGNLTGAGIDSLVSFPAGLQKAFSQWQVTSTAIDDRPITVLQGTNPGQLPVNLYFDDTGLLVRLVRWSKIAVGTIPTQIDYSDYRDVAGVKMPYHMVVTWTDGQDNIELSQIRANVAIDAARFGVPAPYQGH